jgi:tetratricopeptide (TPR) repeat protein
LFVGTEAAAQSSPLADARAAFYAARYEDAAALTQDLCAADDFEACELRTSAILFEVKRAIGDDRRDKEKGKERGFGDCAKCPALMEAFLEDIARGQAATRARLRADPADEEALFFLGKLDLNYVWMQLGTLGKRTGWGEYWEARKSLDAVLKRNPHHVRAKVARAWIDYIVDTRMPRGTRWILGGGSKKRALTALQEATDAESEFFTTTEARFALWEMQAREQNFSVAVVIARQLAIDFPTNTDLTKFLQTHDPYFEPAE